MALKRLVVILAVLLFLLPAAPAAVATHSCVDDVPCYPHPDTHPKTIIQFVTDKAHCLILAQPPTGCL